MPPTLRDIHFFLKEREKDISSALRSDIVDFNEALKKQGLFHIEHLQVPVIQLKRFINICL